MTRSRGITPWTLGRRVLSCALYSPPFHPPAPLVIRVQERDVPGALLHLDGLGPMETWKMVLNRLDQHLRRNGEGGGDGEGYDLQRPCPRVNLFDGTAYHELDALPLEECGDVVGGGCGVLVGGGWSVGIGGDLAGQPPSPPRPRLSPEPSVPPSPVPINAGRYVAFLRYCL